MTFLRMIVGCSLAALLVAGCGGGDSTATDGSMDDTALTDTTTTDGQVEEDTAQPDTPQTVTESFRISYLYKHRYESDNTNLWLVRSDGSDNQDLTQGKISCQSGCRISAGLEAIAYVTTASAAGVTVAVAPVVGDQVASDQAVTVSTAARHFLWVGSELFLSEYDEGSNTFTVYVAPASNPGGKQKVAGFTPPEEAEYYTYAGVFRVSPTGQDLALAYTTLGGAAVHHAKRGSDFVKLEPELGVGPGGIGSEYKDADPMAVSPDGKWIVLFTMAEKQLNLHLFPAPGSPGNQKTLRLGPAKQGACETRSNEEYTEVINLPTFSADSQFVYFLGRADCGKFNDPPHECSGNVKPLTDILRVSISLDPSSLQSITQTPKSTGPENIVIDEFVLSPTGESIAFTGSPTMGGDCREYGDREVYVMPIGGGEKRMLTDAVPFKATGLAPHAP